MKKYFILSFAILALTGCRTTMQEDWNYFPKEVSLDNYNHLQFIKVKKGNTVLVNVHENPSTGYTNTTEIESNCSVSIDGGEFIQDETSTGLVGAPGVRTYKVTGKETGTCLVEFQTHAPGENEDVQKKGIYFIVE